MLGQDAYVDSLVRAMRRPFVLGTEGEKARSVLLIWGPAGTGRHFALRETARLMAARGLLQSDKAAQVDLALYPDPGTERLFLQDLYAALNAPGEMVLFEHYESCCPAFLRTLADLAVKGAAPLASRYLVNREGILVDAGSALAAGAVSRITPRGKYLIFFSHKGRQAMAEKLGAGFVAALGDVCQTQPFTPESLQALAARQLNELARRCTRQLALTLQAGQPVRDYVAAQAVPREGAGGMAACCDRIFRALSEYCLRNDSFRRGTAVLDVENGVLRFSIDGSVPAPLEELLPPVYDGGAEQVRRELDALVGLEEVKSYVFGLADNVQVQKRRAAAGMKTASLSMHMIFTGNPGTGKTTIARLVARYLKAIGALRGRPAGGGEPRGSGGPLHRPHRAPDQQRHRERSGGRAVHRRGIQPLPGPAGQLWAGGHRHPGEGDGGPPGRSGGDPGGLHQRDAAVPHGQQRPWPAGSPTRSSSPTTPPASWWTSPCLWRRGGGTVWTTAAPSRCWGITSAGRPPTAVRPAMAVWPATTLEKAIYNQSRRLVAEPSAPLDLILPGDLEFEE